MLTPRCQGCGGVLTASPRAEYEALDPAATATAPRVTLSPVFGIVARAMLFMVLMFAAARFGWESGGPGLALAAVGITGLFTVPLIVSGR